MNSNLVNNGSKTPPPLPWVTIVLSVLCVLTRILYGFMSPMERGAMVELAGASPVDVANALGNHPGFWPESGIITVASALFIHSSSLHLLGNLAYLWVFGIPVERRLGPFRLALIFLLGGSLAHVIVAIQLPNLDLPVIGASGAVSAVVGAYLGLFPSRRIGMLLPLGLYLQFAHVPALLVIGSWFTLQLVYTVFGPITGAVAWWTHLAGFALGLIFALLARALAQFRV